MRIHRVCAIAAGMLSLASITACGVPVNSSPAVLSKAAVPFNLLAPAPRPSSTTTTVIRHSEVAVAIFLLSGSGHLAPVEREIPSDQVTLESVLAMLLGGPTPAEAAEGLQSAIPPQTTLIGAGVTGELATVNFGGTFGQLVGVAQVQAVAQIVFTAMTVPGVNLSGVSFQLGGQPVEVPEASGSQVPVVNESDFATLAPTPFIPSASP